VIEEAASAPLASANRAVIGWGEVSVVEKVVGYKKIKFYTQENLGFGDILLPEDTVHTQATWFTIPKDAVEALQRHSDYRTRRECRD
jgi:DEAD/DEAH box helicase domain-containing protein